MGNPGDRECRVSADAVHRQGCRHDPGKSTRRRHCCRHACCDAATGPLNPGDATTALSDSDSGENCGSPARAVRRQSRGSTSDHADQPGDQAWQNPASGEEATGPSGSNGVGECGSPAGAVRRDICGSASDHPDCGVDATTGLADPRCIEDCGNPAGAVRRDNGGGARDHADHAANFPEEADTIPPERIWCISEDLPVPDAGGDATSLPPPDGVAGALAWLSRRPPRSEQPLVQHTSHGHRLRWAHAVVAMVTR